MAGISLATAYLSIVPSLDGMSREISRGMNGVGERAGSQFSDDFVGSINGSRFGEAGQDAGQQFGSSAAGTAQSGGGQAGDSFLGGLKGKAMLGIAGVAAAVGAAFVDSYNEAVDRRKSEAKAQATLGISPEEAKGLGKIAGQLYASGYGESMSDLTDAAATVKSSIKGLDDGQLKTLTGQALSFSQAFGTDVSESMQSVSTLMNSGLVPDSTKAFDLITRASQKVPEALRGDILDASDEYSQYFRTLGFSGDQAFDLLVKGSEKGTYGIDKAGDAIKEFTIRSTDMSASSVEAYQAIGLDAQTMANNILAGGDTAQGATQKIIDGILGIEDPSKRANTAIALFGTQMEDMNVADIPSFLEGLKGTSGALGDTAGAAAQMDSAMGSTTTGIELLWRNLKTNLVEFITDKVMPAVTELGQWFWEKFGPAITEAGEWIQTTLVPAIGELVGWLGERLGPLVQDVADFVTEDLFPAWQKFADWFMTTALPALQPVIDFIGKSVENVVTVVRNVIDVIGGVLSGDWSRVWEGIKGIFSTVWDQIVNILGTVGEVLSGLGGKLLEWVSGLPGLVGEKLGEFAQFMVDKGIEFLSWLGQGIEAKAVEIGAWFAALPGVLWSWILAGAQWVVDRGYEFLAWLGQGIEAKAVELGGWFAALPGVLWNAVAAAAQWVIDRGAEYLGYFWSGIKIMADEALQWFVELPGYFWEGVKLAAQWVWDRGSEFLGWLWSGITTKAEEVKTWFVNLPGVLWNKLLEAGGGAVAWVTSKGSEFIGWIKTGLDNGVNAVFTFFSELPGKAWDKIVALKDGILSAGSKIIEWIGQGITNAAHFVWDALKDVFEGDGTKLGSPTDIGGGINDIPEELRIPGGAGGGVATLGARAVAAGGGVLPGYAPGIDSIPAILAPGEAVMVPEWTRAVGVENVYAMNRAARAGRHVPLDSFLGREKFAAGGVAGLRPTANTFGEDISKRIADGIKAGKDQDEAVSGLSFGGSSKTGFLDGILSLGQTIASRVKSSAGAGGFAGNGQWGPATDGSRLADNTQAAKNFITGKWGITDIGGVYGGSVPGSDHPVGKALDVMIANYKSAAGIAQGTSVADWFVNNPQAFGTKYVIWRDRINQGGTWTPYSHPSGNDDNLQHRNHVHLSFLTGAGQFSGQPVGDTNKSMSGFLGDLISKAGSAVAQKFGLTAGGTGAVPAPVEGGKFPGTVERWRGLATQALAAFGWGPEWTDTMLWQMLTESTGNPNAINLTDSNARKGTPSKGLLQTIDSTFTAALQGTPYANLIPKGPYDPWANLLAAVSYVTRKFGGPSRWLPAVGGHPNPYDVGGWVEPGLTPVLNLTGRKEAVLTAPQWETADQAMRKVNELAGGGGRGDVVFSGDIHLGHGGPTDLFEEALWQIRMAGV